MDENKIENNKQVLEEDAATTKVAYSIYIMNLASLLLPVLPIIAVIFAYIFDNDAKSILKSHYQYLIRSFWIGMLYGIIASLSIVILIGFVLVPLVIIWWLIRMIKGLKSLMRNQPITDPTTWLF